MAERLGTRAAGAGSRAEPVEGRLGSRAEPVEGRRDSPVELVVERRGSRAEPVVGPRGSLPAEAHTRLIRTGLVRSMEEKMRAIQLG